MVIHTIILYIADATDLFLSLNSESSGDHRLLTMTTRWRISVCLSLTIIIAGAIVPCNSEIDRGKFKLLSKAIELEESADRKIKAESPNQYSLGTKPSSTAVYVGDDTYFQCAGAPGSNVRVQWWETASSPIGNPRLISERTVMLGHPNVAKYEIQQEGNNSFTLHIYDVQMTDVGTYICVDGDYGPPCPGIPDDQQDFIGIADLTVLGDLPQCDTTFSPSGETLETDYNTAECLISILGNIKPVMTWSGPSPYTVYSQVGSDFVWSGIELYVEDKMDGLKFTSVSRFPDSSLPLRSANESDEAWQFTYSTPTLRVSWGPKNLYHTPNHNHYFSGESITCVANANPAANITWTNLQTQEVSGDTFTITDEHVGSIWTYRCQARNIIQGKIYATNYGVNFTVTDNSSVLILRQDTAGAAVNYFNRSLSDFKNWFGNPAAQYWIGLDRLNAISQGDCVLRFNLQRSATLFYYAQYSSFYIDGPETNYTIAISGYSGNLTDAMAIHNGQQFSTYDSDNDKSTSNCALSYRGGFWYNNCGNAFVTASPASQFYWASYSLTVCEVRMMC